jgi:hypothetical protein
VPTDSVRACDQPQDRESPRPHRAAYAARPCRRGDRVSRNCRAARVRKWPTSAATQPTVSAAGESRRCGNRVADGF